MPMWPWLTLPSRIKRLHRGPDDLRRNRESHSGESAGRRDQEGVDPDHFAAGIDQRSAGVAWIDGRVRLDELARLAGIGRVRIGAVHGADDAARYRETESVRIAEGQHGLSGPNFFRVAPGSAGQIGGVHFQDRQVGQRIGADQFRFQDAPIAGGHADVDGSIDHVIVGDDVAVGRDHDAAAHAVLDLGLRCCMCGPKNCPNGTALAALTKELLHVLRHLPAGHVGLGFEVTVTLTTAGVTRAARVSIALSRASSALTLSASSGAAAGAASAARAAAGFTNS